MGKEEHRLKGRITILNNYSRPKAPPFPAERDPYTSILLYDLEVIIIMICLYGS